MEFEKSEVDQDNNGEEEEEIEEIEESSGSGSHSVENLLVIIGLFLSTLYISSMNSPIPSPIVEAIRGLKMGNYGIYQFVDF